MLLPDMSRSSRLGRVAVRELISDKLILISLMFSFLRRPPTRLRREKKPVSVISKHLDMSRSSRFGRVAVRELISDKLILSSHNQLSETTTNKVEEEDETSFCDFKTH